MTRKPKSRIDGEGSIYQDGDSFVAQISIKGRLYRRRRRTKDEALAELDTLRSKRNRRLNLEATKPTFAQWYDTYLTANRKIKAGTRDNYRRIVDRLAIPTLGAYQLDTITAMVLQDWVNELDDQGLAPNTIKNVAARVRTALARALRDQLITYNPAIGLELPSGRKRMPIALDEEQARALLAAVQTHRSHLLYVLALTLGLRQGELLALKWSDLSWKHQTLTIARTLRRTGKNTIEDTTKTEAGHRVLDLSDDLVQALRSHWSTQQEEHAVAAKKNMPNWNADKRIFCTETGREIAARNLLRHFDAVQTAAKLPAMVFHDLRHTAGSLMLRRGADMLDVSKILGHSSPSVTANIYAHSYTDRRKKATADLAGALLEKRAK